MRSLLIVLAGACASAATSGLVWATLVRTTAPYCEVVQASLLRTTAAEWPLNLAVAEAMERARQTDADAEQSYVESASAENTDVWFSTPNFFGQEYERVSRLTRRQVDESGNELRVEVIRGVEMPTLVFVDHASSAVQEQIVRQIAEGLAVQGVTVR